MRLPSRLAGSLVFFLLTVQAGSQVSFSNKTFLLKDSTGFFSGIAVAVADMNADGLDDIVRFHRGKMLSIEYQSGNGLPFMHYSFGQVSNEEAWSVAVGDVNNDGYCDILTGGYYDGMRVLAAVDSAQTYQANTLPGATIFVQGSNFADINNDGFIDVFACHDDGASRIWANDGDGGFVQANDWINFATVPASDNSGNYGSVWTDFDNDGDMDLYIAKCRQGVENPNDPRRINALYVNDGRNQFREAAAEFGLGINWQSWTADFQDIDNDGDLDCFVTNHDYRLQLLENNGAGHFTDISEQAGITATGEFLQGIMRDFDNDGFVDILTAEPAMLFKNNGNKTFTRLPNPFAGTDLGTFAIGDLNHDGWLDVYAAYACNINTPCNIGDKLWINNGAQSSHHFMSVNLKGNQSNRMGIGARIEIYGSWGIQVREVRSGESYGIMNSLTQHFGLGQADKIAYLVVRWPSGEVDVVKDPPVDQFLTVEEGSTCNKGTFGLELSGEPSFCYGEFLTLSAPEGYDYLWNNGKKERTIKVSRPGNYKAVIVDDTGCFMVSNLVRADYRQEMGPVIEVLGETTFCQGDSLVITASGFPRYQWSNGDTSQSIAVHTSGNFYVAAQGYCGEYYSETVTAEVLPSPAPQTGDIFTYDTDTVLLIAQGNAPRWYVSPTGLEPVAVNDTLAVFGLQGDTTFFVEDVHSYGGGQFSAGMPVHQGSPYSGNQFNGQVIFDVFEAFTLEKVTVYTNQAGKRIIELLDADNDVVDSFPVEIPEGETEVLLNFHIQPGNSYKLTTNLINNRDVFGFNSPRLQRSDNGVQYPYTIPGVLSITGSNIGTNFYYYFYDWQIKLDETVCISERVPVRVTVLPNAVRDQEWAGSISLAPNPSNGSFFIRLLPMTSGPAQLSVADAYGRMFYNRPFEITAGTLQQFPIHLGEVPPGIYFLQLSIGDRQLWKMLVVR